MLIPFMSLLMYYAEPVRSSIMNVSVVSLLLFLMLIDTLQVIIDISGYTCLSDPLNKFSLVPCGCPCCVELLRQAYCMVPEDMDGKDGGKGRGEMRVQVLGEHHQPHPTPLCLNR